ncbi:hypothetical protein NPIL_538921 [Nephila pilipes]|uniref:Uncharacterized protein n=1 Tax=Nephila pilipes TaxID=299642 RepID=A0A8X6K9Z8_NEPPI|nr:hypothetical protein NPIL_538921 [Nephila pilipes]
MSSSLFTELTLSSDQVMAAGEDVLNVSSEEWRFLVGWSTLLFYYLCPFSYRLGRGPCNNEVRIRKADVKGVGSGMRD